jgi:F-type H+-transporting ATPase subunit b
MEALLASGIKLGLVELNQSFFLQIFNTLVLFAFLRWKLFGPVSEMMQKRTERIKASFDEAEMKHKTVDELKASYEAKLAGIREEEQRIVAEARLRAEQRATDIIKHAEVEIGHLKAHAAREIEQEREKAINQLKDEIASLAILAASKVIGSEIDAAKHSEMISDYIERVGDSKWHN